MPNITDRIGRDDIVNKINSIISNMRQDAHCCIALNGDWGSGKTLANYSVLPVDNWGLEVERLKNRGSDGKYEEFCFVLQSYAELFVESEVNAKLAV